jgi:hypothetical protein
METTDNLDGDDGRWAMKNKGLTNGDRQQVVEVGW